MTGFVAVHCGAGLHKEKNHLKYNKLSRRACIDAISTLRQGGSALEAVKNAIIVLENDPITNAGVGSNLTSQGIVECDASIMDGKTLQYGGCGAVKKLKNPIELAYDICVKQNQELPLGLVPPSFLVGVGALQEARKSGLKIVRSKDLMTTKTYQQFKKYNEILKGIKMENNLRMDTVGAVCVDDHGHVATACSSGGLLMKKPGRVGQGALYASGVWADSYDKKEPSVAVCTTGCGEYLVKTQLAKEIACDLQNCDFPTLGMYNSISEKFLKSKVLHKIKEKMGGALAIHVTDTGQGTVLWGHTTTTMSVGYMKTSDIKAKAVISELPKEKIPGFSVNVSGVDFYLKD